VCSLNSAASKERAVNAITLAVSVSSTKLTNLTPFASKDRSVFSAIVEVDHSSYPPC